MTPKQAQIDTGNSTPGLAADLAKTYANRAHAITPDLPAEKFVVVNKWIDQLSWRQGLTYIREFISPPSRNIFVGLTRGVTSFKFRPDGSS